MNTQASNGEENHRKRSNPVIALFAGLMRWIVPRADTRTAVETSQSPDAERNRHAWFGWLKIW